MTIIKNLIQKRFKNLNNSFFSFLSLKFYHITYIYHWYCLSRLSIICWLLSDLLLSWWSYSKDDRNNKYLVVFSHLVLFSIKSWKYLFWFPHQFSNRVGLKEQDTFPDDSHSIAVVLELHGGHQVPVDLADLQAGAGDEEEVASSVPGEGLRPSNTETARQSPTGDIVHQHPVTQKIFQDSEEEIFQNNYNQCK